MGASLCAQMYRMGQEAGMIPDSRMDHSFTGYLSTNSSAYLNSHYMEVRHSLSPDQLGVFDSGVRAVLGQSGTVTRGGVGVVALALSLLFDVLAQQANNETRKTNFIRKIFRDHQTAYSTGSKVGTVVLDYLYLVPLIANDPQRMMEETERYEQKLNHTLFSHYDSTYRSQISSWKEWKILIHGLALHQHMMIHRARMGADIPMEQLLEKDWQKYSHQIAANGPKSLVEISNVFERLMSLRPEKRKILEDCKDKDDAALLGRFQRGVRFGGFNFFEDVQKYHPIYMSQREDFKYT